MLTTARQIHDVRSQIKSLQDRISGNGSLKPVHDGSAELDKKLAGIEDKLVNWKIRANEDSLQYPVMLDGQLSNLASYIGAGTDSAPTEAAEKRFAELKQQVEANVSAWNTAVSTDIAGFQKLAGEHGLQVLVLPQAAK